MTETVGPALDQDVSVPAGDSAVITIPIKDRDGNFVDLNGATARWWVGKNAKATGSNIFIQKSTENVDEGLEITRPGALTEYDLVITLFPADTEGMAPKTYYHEAEIVDADGNIATVTTGKFIVTRTMIPDVL